MAHLVQHYFSQSAQEYPEKTAVYCDSQSRTFREIEEYTNAIANFLRSNGLKRGSFVPFFMKKGVNSIHAILSILKSDCAYVPVDVNSPPNRVLSILDACDARLVIVDRDSLEQINSIISPERDLSVFVIDDFEDGDTSPVACENLSIDIAYVLFTSGSTGVPKGVMIPHKAIIDYIEWCVAEYSLSNDDVIANHAPLYFDNSTFDLYTAFRVGAELNMVHDELNAVIPFLVKWIRERRITTFFCVPSVMSMLLRSRRLRKDSFPDLRHVIAAGEVLPVDVLRSWMELYPHIQFTNMYGPTEITVDCSFHVIREVPGEDVRSIPIGGPRPNMELFVRCDNGNLSQLPGDRGELLVRGTSVAYGYLGDAERTAAAFIQNPTNTLFHDQLYCTGDIVEIDASGDFIFLGRRDDQIKYLGYRIELGEIEAALNSLEELDEAVVIFNNAKKTEDSAIGAMIGGKGADSESVRNRLRKKLPSYMVPSRILVRSGPFPMTPNGKYDRKAIKALVFAETAQSAVTRERSK